MGAGLIRRLGREVNNPELFERAVAHRSWCAEHPGRQSNERLEFLGDAVLGLVVTNHVYRTYPDMAEGKLAQVRAAVVNAGSLAEAAEGLGLGDHVLLGKGEDASGGREKPSILADALEAVIGAVYLDGGFDQAVDLVMALLGELITMAAAGPGSLDFKTRLQELAAQRYDELPRYDVVASGPDHAKSFTATVNVAGRALGVGHGRSKKQAEQAAARSAWENMASGANTDGLGAAPGGPGRATEGPEGDAGSTEGQAATGDAETAEAATEGPDGQAATEGDAGA